MFRTWAVALIWATSTLAAVAQTPAIKKRFPGWEVEVEKDRFGGPSRVVAVTVKDATGLAVRCLRGELSLAVIEFTFGQGRFNEGLLLDVKFRADGKEIIESKAFALDDKGFQLEKSHSLVRTMLGSKEYALRISYRGTTYDRIFPARGGDKAIVEMLKECPLDEKAD